MLDSESVIIKWSILGYGDPRRFVPFCYSISVGPGHLTIGFHSLAKGIRDAKQIQSTYKSRECWILIYDPCPTALNFYQLAPHLNNWFAVILVQQWDRTRASALSLDQLWYHPFHQWLGRPSLSWFLRFDPLSFPSRWVVVAVLEQAASWLGFSRVAIASSSIRKSIFLSHFYPRR